jgi:TRAP-type C4-dicarboxylate transport system substrate-binding protein
MGQFQVAFKESVESKTDSITIENFFEGELGGTVEVIESVAEGNIDMNACHHYPGAASTLGIPELAFFSSPLIFDDYEDTLRAINPENTDFAREMHDRHIEEADTRILTSFAFGTRCFSMTGNRVTTPEEVGGARLRGPDGDLMTAVIEGLGGEPVIIDWQETPQALATGQADGIEQILWALEIEPIIENTDYLILTRHMPEAIGLTINEGVFQDLTDEQQQVLEEAATETRESQLEEALERDQGRVENIADAGVEVVDEESGLQLDVFRESVFASVEEQFSGWAEVREELTAAL